MSLFKKLLSKVSLRYDDPTEEQEYFQTKMPLLKEFFKYLFLALTGIVIPYTVRYFVNDISPQNIIFAGLIGVAVLIFLVQKKLAKYLEIIIIGYIVAIITILLSAFHDGIVVEREREIFYVGYAFAMIPRLVGYGVIKVRYMLLLYIISISLKFPLVPNPDAVLNIIVVVLDVLTVALSFKSEISERALFDSLYKSKKDILKFKHLITRYLPNQITILSSENAEACYMNNVFKRSFKCEDVTQVKTALGKYSVEKETIEKDKGFFLDIGFIPQAEEPNLSLTRFIECLSKNFDRLQRAGLVSFPVIENEKTEEELQFREPERDITKDMKDGNNQARTSFEMKPMQKLSQRADSTSTKAPNVQNGANTVLNVGGDMNETLKSNDRGSSNSNSSDFILEEGRRRVYKVKIFPIVWDDKQAMAMVLDDITQQRIIMELKIADKNKDLVIATVSHELRTPLNGMLGLLDIARKHIDHSDASSYLSACKNSGVLMLNLVNSILDLNQIKNKKLRLVFIKTSIQDLLYETKALFDYFCLIKNLYLKIEVGPGVPKMITTDKNRLSQIIVNLLGNAFKFTFQGGVTVKVDLECYEPCRIKFSIQDTGIGIKKEDQARLFKMYGKLEQEDQKINTQGIGLGLTISNTLAMLLNPDSKPIQVESEVNVGTSFSFVIQSQSPETANEELSLADISSLVLNEDRDLTILKKMSIYTNNNNENFTKMIASSQNLDSRPFLSPETRPLISSNKKDREPLQPIDRGSQDNIGKLLKPIAELIKRESSNKSQNGIKYKRIEEKDDIDKPWCLVVDDNPFNLMVACHIMEERGYKVKTGLNGMEAIQKAKDHKAEGFKFVVVLMDCQMPVMDGYEATKVLREMMKAGEIEEYAIVALTANNRDEDHDKLCKEVGMSGHVSKPLQIDELETVLREVQKLG